MTLEPSRGVNRDVASKHKPAPSGGVVKGRVFAGVSGGEGSQDVRTKCSFFPPS